jgi:hypothetical protein
MLYFTSCTQEAEREREISSDGGDDSINYHLVARTSTWHISFHKWTCLKHFVFLSITNLLLTYPENYGEIKIFFLFAKVNPFFVLN